MLEPNLAHSESLPAVQRSFEPALTLAMSMVTTSSKCLNIIYKIFTKLIIIQSKLKGFTSRRRQQEQDCGAIMKLFRRMGAEKVQCNINLRISSFEVQVI